MFLEFVEMLILSGRLIKCLHKDNSVGIYSLAQSDVVMIIGSFDVIPRAHHVLQRV